MGAQVSLTRTAEASLSGIGDLTVSTLISDTYDHLNNPSPVSLSARSNKAGLIRAGLISAARRKLLENMVIRKVAQRLQIVPRGTWNTCSPGRCPSSLAKANPLKGGDAKLPV